MARQFRLSATTPYVLIAFVLGFPLVKFAYRLLTEDLNYDVYFSDYLAKVLLMISCLYLLSWAAFSFRWVAMCVLVLIGWCASISWGYQSPAIFSTPLLYIFLIVSHRFLDVKNVYRLAHYALFCGLITYLIAYQKPYCNPARATLHYSIAHLFPKMQGIRVSKEAHDKYTDFYHLVRKYGDNFKTLPGMPLSNYLTNTHSPIPLDWVGNGGSEKAIQPLEEVLAQKKTIVFAEKNPHLIRVTNSDNKFHSYVTWFIKNNWQKIDSTTHFEVYRAPNVQ